VDRSGIHRRRQGVGIEEHLGWSVEVVTYPPKARGENGNRAAISTISLACGLSGSGYHPNRRNFAALYRDAG
jgi:hypothetical protein